MNAVQGAKAGFFRKSSDVDMTSGSILRHIISFALPLLLGNLFQQFYNTVDTWVVGNYVSDSAFSAVGTVGPIINMLIGFFTGLSAGTGVVISQYFGARQYTEVRESVHTALVVTFFMSILFTVVGILIVPWMLTLVNMPAELVPEATTYLTIYFAGSFGLLFYNMGAGILRAVGDSTRPFLCLVVCALANTAMDLVLVLGLGKGVEGVAYATLIAQLVSAILVIILLMRSKSCIQVKLKWMKVNWRMLGKIIAMGIPAAIQNSIVNISNVFVQGYINFFKSDAMGGWTAYNKLDSLLWLPASSISLAATTFVGQNMGKGQISRAKKGLWVSVGFCAACSVILAIPLIIFAPYCVGFFNSNEAVIQAGTDIIHHLTPLYVIVCMNTVVLAAIRGAGKSKESMLIGIASYVGFRQLYLFIVSRVRNELIPIAMSYPAGWIFCLILWVILVWRMDWEKGVILRTHKPEKS